jgi:hypothetical protein
MKTSAFGDLDAATIELPEAAMSTTALLPPRRTRPAARHTLPSPRDRARLGDLEVGVSPVCLGLVQDPRVVPAAFDAGVNFFFVTADMHWPLYERLRRGLALLLARGGGVRDEIVVAAVSYVAQPEFSHLPFREVVDAVPGLGRVDVTVAGGVYAPDLLPRLVSYREHRRGVLPGVRGTGATFHDRVAAREAVAHDLVDAAFVRYNPVHRGAEEDLFPHLPDRGRALVYNFKSTLGHLSEQECRAMGLGPDDWRPAWGDYYRFALAQPAIDGVLCALGEEAHVEALADALAEGPLDEEASQYLRDLADLAAGRATLVAPASPDPPAPQR